RGGGSLEDLWAFNEEIVARAIAASSIPVISAVGHEPDVTISDFAADARASTPSNAAELCVPDCAELKRLLLSVQTSLAAAMQQRLERERQSYQALEHRRQLRTPTAYIQDKRIALDYASGQMQAAMGQLLTEKRGAFAELAAYLDAYSPLKVLSRGYSVVSREDGRIVNSSALLKKGEAITIQFAKGRAQCTVEQVKRK
ncbi:MAG: exodeoxyribonuclease VII large subunit, partial [Butyricicoccaceae bacterium]